MNILLIGNGFDLAHELPTRYTDFLEFCTMIEVIYNIGIQDDLVEVCETNYIIKNCEDKNLISFFANLYLKRKTYREDDYPYGKMITDTIFDEFYEMINNNLWIKYFNERINSIGANWIDFESEISNVIKKQHGIMKKINANLEDKFVSDFDDFFYKMYEYKDITFKYLRDRLVDDLNMLIRALEIYLCEFVEKIEIRKKSPDIEKLKIDVILSFNYTHTFSRLYQVSERSKKEIKDPFDYIHGEANTNNAMEKNNMVLGIDEYLGKKRRNKEIEFIAFKKYYQRIYKGTGCKYKDWLEIIKQNGDEIEATLKKKYPKQIPINYYQGKKHYLYIFGHSLDVTDKDILNDLILNDNVYTIIFYRDQEQRGQQIANLVKVIGQDELIRRTGGSTKTIKFELQKDM